MARKSGNFSVLQFDGHGISVLRFWHGPKGLDILAHVQQRGLGGVSGEALAAALREFVDSHEIAGDRVYTVLPRHEVTTRVVELPSSNPEEIARMVRLSAEEYVPYPVDELIIDQAVLGASESGFARVFVTLVHRDVVQAHAEAVRAAGIVPEQVFLSTACLAAAATALQPAGDMPLALVNLAPGGLEVLALASDKLAYSRGVASEQDWTASGDDGARAREEMALEVRGSLGAYRRESEDGLGADQVFVCGDGIDAAAMAQALADETGKDCRPASDALALVAKGAEKLDGLPLTLLGAAWLVHDPALLRIELLPETFRRGREMAQARRVAWHAAGMAAAVLVACAVWYGQASYQRHAMVSKLQRHLDVLDPSARGIAAKREQLQILARQVGKGGNVLEVLAALAEQAPEKDLNINSFRYSRDLNIEFNGRTRKLDDLHAYLDDIRGMGAGSLEFLAQARKLYDNPMKERDESVFNYQVQIPIAEEGPDNAVDF